MQTTLITEKNAKMFIEAIPQEVISASNLFLGAIDEETDTACGVLAAILDDDNNILITFIYVAEQFRRRGAGTEMIGAIKEIAERIKADEISCIHTRTTDDDGVYELLERCGFEMFDAATVTTYEAKLSDLSIPDAKVASKIVPIKSITDYQWNYYSSKINLIEKEDDSGNIIPLRSREKYDKDHSFVCISDDDRVVGSLLVNVQGSEISLEELQVFEDKTGRMTLDLIIKAGKKAKKDFPPDTTVIMNPYSDEHKKVMYKLSDGHARKRSETIVQWMIM